MTSGAISVLRSGAPGIAFERRPGGTRTVLEQVADQREERGADHDAGPAAQPADDRHDHEDQREVEAPGLGRDERVVEREQRAGQAGEHAREHEREQRERPCTLTPNVSATRGFSRRASSARPDFVFIMRQSIQRTTARNARQR